MFDWRRGAGAEPTYSFNTSEHHAKHLSIKASAVAFSEQLHFCTPASRGQQTAILKLLFFNAEQVGPEEWSRTLTSVDYGVHLQDSDVSFVEGHFIAQAPSFARWLRLLLFLIN